MSRPELNTAGLETLPAATVARMVAKAQQSWCYVTPDGRSFFVTEAQANGMRAKNGGAVYPPVWE
jgi:hypothetical protein